MVMTSFFTNYCSLTPHDADEPVAVSLKKTKEMDVEISNCNPVNAIHFSFLN